MIFSKSVIVVLLVVLGRSRRSRLDLVAGWDVVAPVVAVPDLAQHELAGVDQVSNLPTDRAFEPPGHAGVDQLLGPPAGELDLAAMHWWATSPAVIAGVLGIALIVAELERRVEADPAFAFGLLLGAAGAYATVCLNAVVHWAGGKPEVRDLAGVVILAHLPVVAVESVGLGFLVAFLARARPEWLTDQRPAGSGNTSSNGTSH